MSADPPYLTVGTDVSAKYKGAFCEAKIKKCQKSVKCKVAPKDGGPQISVNDDAIQGELRISAPVKVRQPDSGQIIDGTIVRIVDSSVYTVVFDDGDVATLKRTQICLKGDKHFTESETLDKLPLTNPEHFSTPVNLIKKERRKRGQHGSPSGTVSDESDIEDDLPGHGRRMSPRASKSSGDLIGKVVLVDFIEKKKFNPGLIIKPANHESDMKLKGLILVKSFRDNKIMTVSERQIKEFTKDAAKGYPDDKFLKSAYDRALAYVTSKELPASWKREDLLGSQEVLKAENPPDPEEKTSMSEDDNEDDEDEEEEDEEQCDIFLANLTKFMEDRNTPINKTAQLYDVDVNLYKMFNLVKRSGGFNKASKENKWKSIAHKLSFTATQAAMDVKLFYRRYLLPYEEFIKKMGDSHMFDSMKGSVSGGRNVLPPKEREGQHTSALPGEEVSVKAATDKKSNQVVTPRPKAEPDASPSEDTIRKTPSRQSYRKEEKPSASSGGNPNSIKAPESPVSRGKSTSVKPKVKLEKIPKLDLDKDDDKSSDAKGKKMAKAAEEEVKMEDELVNSDEEGSSVTVEVEYPPGTKLKVRYGRNRNMKTYDAKVMEVKLAEDRQLLYSVHYSGWNTRYDETITADRIVGAVGKCEKKTMEIFREGHGPKSKKPKPTNTCVNYASSTGSRTPEPLLSKTGVPKTAQSARVSSKVGGSLPVTPANRSTRASVSESSVVLSRPTRSKSIDTLPTGLPQKSSKVKKLADEADTKEPTEHEDASESDDGNDEEDDEVSERHDIEKSATVRKESSSDAVESSDAATDGKTDDPLIKLEDDDDENSDSTPSEAINEDEDDLGQSSSDPLLRPVVKKSTKAIQNPASPSTSVHSDGSFYKRGTKSDSPTPLLRSEARMRLVDVKEKESMEDLSAGEKMPETSAPPCKKKKVEREDSVDSMTMEVNFNTTRDENAECLELPPLMSQPETSGSGSPRADDSRPDSEQSYNSDCEISKSQQTSASNKSPEKLLLDPPTAELQTKAELTNTLNTSKNNKQKINTRRLPAKRSPKHRPAALDDDLTAADAHMLASASVDSISPNKILRQNASVRRQPKFNFKIEEELAQISDQDLRITYLTNKLAEIRSLYSEVKSNLASIERKRKRVKRKDRDIFHYGNYSLLPEHQAC